VIVGAASAVDDHCTYENFGDQQSHDVNVTGNSDPQTGDHKMCWAAASANILDWTVWGDICGDDQIIYDDLFREYWTNEGGLMKYAWQWFYLGKESLPCWLQTEPPKCQACPGDWAKPIKFSDDPKCVGQLQASDFFNSYCYYGEFHDGTAINVIKCLLDAGYGVTITVYNEGALSTDPGHALTVWGYRIDANETVTDLLLADSMPGSNETKPPSFPVRYDGSKWHIVGTDWLIESVHALKSQDSEAGPGDCEIDCAAGAILAIVRKKCMEIFEDENGKIIVDENGEIVEGDEIPCAEVKGTVRIEYPEKDEPIDIDSPRFIAPFSVDSEFVIEVPLGKLFKKDKFLRWEVGGDVEWKEISDEKIKIQTTNEDFCLRPVIGHCAGC